MLRKNKIIYIISTLVKSGPVNVLYNLVKYLDKNEYDITIITLSPENNEHSLWSDFETMGVNLISLNLSRVQGYLYGGFKLRKIIDKINPDIIHTHCFRSNLFSALFLNKYKKCSTVHSDYKTDLINLYPKYGYLLFIINHLSLFFIKNNICCSEVLANLLNKKYPYMNFSFVNNGIDTEIFHPVKDKNDLREKLNLPKNKKIFIWTGSFIKRKNPFYLVNTILRDTSDKNYYIFCGDGPILKDCINRLENKTNTLFTGRIDNVVEYIQASDYLIATSFSEGLPMSVLEAGACGLPCLLSNIPQHGILFEHKLEIGKLINLKNNNSLLQNIKEIGSLDYETFSKNVKFIVNKQFSAQKMAEEYMKLYRYKGNEI